MNPTQGTATYLQIEFLERKNAELEQQLAEQAAQLEAEKIRSAAILESIDGCAGRVAELRQQLAKLREAVSEYVDTLSPNAFNKMARLLESSDE